MTTSAARISKSSHRGFTLLEIVIVLALAAVITGGAVGLMVYSSDERALRAASSEIEVLAKRARTISMLKQTPYALEFRQGKVSLLPFSLAGSDEKVNSPRNAITWDRKNQYLLEDGMELSIRHWNSNEWIRSVGNTTQVWRFDPDGLVEPISVHLKIKNSWAEDAYHPLTASIRDHQMEASK